MARLQSDGNPGLLEDIAIFEDLVDVVAQVSFLKDLGVQTHSIAFALTVVRRNPRIRPCQSRSIAGRAVSLSSAQALP